MEFTFCGAVYKPHASWIDFFTPAILDELEYIARAAGSGFTPPADKVLRFCMTDLSLVRVIILGQDPYPQPGVATGRAFEVGNIKSWAELKRNASLVNILKLLHMNHLQLDEPVGIAQIRKDMDSGLFPLLPPARLFGHLEGEGVLFLNTALTCLLNNSGSHAEIWKPFSAELFRFITDNNPRAKWLLWGKDAQEFCSFAPDERKLTSYHPRLFDRKPGSFLYENHFAACPEIDWIGLQGSAD
ncbi:uracil-DNA glycosylase [Maridesulfovibrio sp.]|uniref:uracil-DNA glycosylase n=1 Tax=Maridesulfovibrio sp. TaxID=2795000 RepID=UPI002A18E55E|nr:uracil-DNA glycosylase [Maridesulfovibrio sp.]